MSCHTFQLLETAVVEGHNILTFFSLFIANLLLRANFVSAFRIILFHRCFFKFHQERHLMTAENRQVIR